MPGRDLREKVILVDKTDRTIGSAGKLEVHRKGALHRAFSIFGIDDSGRILLQQRALAKYHCGGLWSNTCCGHPRPGESIRRASSRRLREEFGLHCQTHPIHKTRYRAPLQGRLIEHELAHLLVAHVTATLKPDPDEIADFKYLTWDELRADLANHPRHYTPWLRHYLQACARPLQQAIRRTVRPEIENAPKTTAHGSYL